MGGGGHERRLRSLKLGDLAVLSYNDFLIDAHIEVTDALKLGEGTHLSDFRRPDVLERLPRRCKAP